MEVLLNMLRHLRGEDQKFLSIRSVIYLNPNLLGEEFPRRKCIY